MWATPMSYVIRDGSLDMCDLDGRLLVMPESGRKSESETGEVANGRPGQCFTAGKWVRGKAGYLRLLVASTSALTSSVPGELKANYYSQSLTVMSFSIIRASDLKLASSRFHVPVCDGS